MNPAEGILLILASVGMAVKRERRKGKWGLVIVHLLCILAACCVTVVAGKAALHGNIFRYETVGGLCVLTRFVLLWSAGKSLPVSWRKQYGIIALFYLLFLFIGQTGNGSLALMLLIIPDWYLIAEEGRQNVLIM